MTRFAGVVDGIVRGELCGWLVFPEGDGRAEPVICEGLGRQLTFMPFTLREDVVTALGRPGVFGFSIPTSLLQSLGPRIVVKDRWGDLLEHGEAVEVPPPDAAPAEREPTRIFLHIPKTAGTSLRNALLRDVPTGQYLLIYPGDMPGISVRRALRIPRCQLDQLNWVYGHGGYGFHRFLTRPSRYVSFVREPMARLRSNFNHHAAAGTEFEVGGASVRPSVMINEGLVDEFDNIMTRLLGGVSVDEVPLGHVGEDEVELALYHVREHFDFIGLQSQAASDAATFQRQTHVELAPLAMDNVTPAESRYHPGEVAAVDWERVATHNHADRLLFRRLQQERWLSRALR